MFAFCRPTLFYSCQPYRFFSKNKKKRDCCPTLLERSRILALVFKFFADSVCRQTFNRYLRILSIQDGDFLVAFRFKKCDHQDGNDSHYHRQRSLLTFKIEENFDLSSRCSTSVVPRSGFLGDTGVPLPEFQGDIYKFWGTHQIFQIFTC